MDVSSNIASSIVTVPWKVKSLKVRFELEVIVQYLDVLRQNLIDIHGE